MRPSSMVPPRRRSVTWILVCAQLFFATWFTLQVFSPVSFADDLETQKAIKRNSQDATGSVRGQRRVALVIGNGDYRVGPLRNPAHDAEDISDVLRTLGFSVQTKINVNQREMEEAVNKFIQDIQNGDVALFYFSGHGVQVRGENYLIPIGDSIESEPDVRYKTVNAGLILAKMEDARNRANIVILDACRNNPFKGFFRSPSTGLSKMDAPKGTFIAYATSPDSVAADGTGRNSPYTKHLLAALQIKDTPIEMAFKKVGRAVNQETGGQQTPWTSSSLMDDFYFNPSATGAQEVSIPTPAPPQQVTVPSTDYLKKGDDYYEGRGVAQNYWEAVKWYRKSAELGNPIAQNNLGRMYQKGWGVTKDITEAAKWYKKSADQRNADGQANLGWMYQNGFGVVQDYKEAVKLFRKSAEQGNALGQNNLGWMYQNGVGVDKDYAEAVKWYRKSAEQGDPWGQYDLGLMYANGYGVSKNRSEAMYWYRKAAAQNHEEAKKALGRMGGALW